jgi:hypothetical protein
VLRDVGHPPDDYCAPFLPLLHGKQPFSYENGECVVPQHPGLGLNIDEAALQHYRVEGLEAGAGRRAHKALARKVDWRKHESECPLWLKNGHLANVRFAPKGILDLRQF